MEKLHNVKDVIVSKKKEEVKRNTSAQFTKVFFVVILHQAVPSRSK